MQQYQNVLHGNGKDDTFISIFVIRMQERLKTKMITLQEIKLSFIEDQILKAFANRLEKEVSEAVQIILFGSRARGDSSEDSDLDIAVILGTPKVDPEIWKKVWEIKWEVVESLQAEEFPLSLNIITLNDLISRDFGVEMVIKTEGVMVWKRKNY